MTLDYLEGNRDERHFWQEKVRSTATNSADDHAAALRLEGELWAYFVERSSVVNPFREQALREGLSRISMRNLADYLVRLWVAPKPKKNRATVES